MTIHRILRLSLLAAFAASVAGCRGKKEEVSADPAAASSPRAPASASASAAGATSAAPAKPVTLRLARYLEKEVTGTVHMFPADGALLVSMDAKVGRLADGKVEWLGQVPAAPPAFGGASLVTWAGGKYPDRIDATYTSTNGRALMPSYRPLTGKGDGYSFAAGGGLGWITGVATIGESTFLMGFGYEGYETARVRGSTLARVPTKPDGGACPGGKPTDQNGRRMYAVAPDQFGGSEDGTMMTIGTLCSQGPAAEVWDKDGKSKIHKLDAWIKKPGSGWFLLHGKGDVSWVVPLGGDPILEYKDGAFAPLPLLPKVTTAFASEGVLHAVDDHAIHRLSGGSWTKVADIAWPHTNMKLALWQGTFYAEVAATLHKLEPGEPIDFHEGCTTPFVSLYVVSDKAEPTYTFPTTRKALATFDKLADISLVEFVEGVRRLGIVVPDKATGEAVIAHLQSTMKDEKPRLVCHKPKEPRVIKLDKSR